MTEEYIPIDFDIPEDKTQRLIKVIGVGGGGCNAVKNMYNEGISKTGDVVDLGVQYGILSKSGAFYKYNDATIGQGREATKKYLKENPEVLAEIDAKVREKVAEPEPKD